jgi:YD repeat-containing protein
MKRISIISILLLNAFLAFSQVTYQYDNLNRLSQVAYANGATVDYTYDELGNRTKKTVVSNSSVAVTDVSLNNTELTLFIGDTVQFIATVSPANATNKAVTWSSSNTSVVTVTNGRVAGVTPGRAIITVTTQDGNKTATCAVTIAGDQQIVVEPEQPEGNRGVLDVSLQVPTDEAFTLAFSFSLPAGFSLDRGSTTLNAELSTDYELDITPDGVNTWQFTIQPKPALRAANDMKYQQLVYIVYLIDEAVGTGEYELTLNDVNLTLSNGEVIHQNEIALSVTIGGKEETPAGEEEAPPAGEKEEEKEETPVGNAPAGTTGIWYVNNQLYVDTPAAERIAIYSPLGLLLYQTQKQPGSATFNLSSLPQGVLIVTGSSGWTKKIVR